MWLAAAWWNKYKVESDRGKMIHDAGLLELMYILKFTKCFFGQSKIFWNQYSN